LTISCRLYDFASSADAFRRLSCALSPYATLRQRCRFHQPRDFAAAAFCVSAMPPLAAAFAVVSHIGYYDSRRAFVTAITQYTMLMRYEHIAARAPFRCCRHIILLCDAAEACRHYLIE